MNWIRSICELIILGFIAVVYVFGVSTLFVAANGFALAVLWRWFVAPTFSLPELGIANAFGIAFLIQQLIHQPSVESFKKVMEDYKRRKMGQVMNHEEARLQMQHAGLLILRPFGVIAIGWLIHLFM